MGIDVREMEFLRVLPLLDTIELDSTSMSMQSAKTAFHYGLTFGIEMSKVEKVICSK